MRGRSPVFGFLLDATFMSLGLGALVALFLALAGLFVGGCAAVSAPPPRTLRLESYEQCVHYAAMFCQRSVEPPDVCTNDLVVRYCR